MKKMHLKRLTALALGLSLMASALIPGVSATDEASATVDTEKPVSLTLYKYDTTTAAQNGAWDVSSYVSTGSYDSDVNAALSKYAIQGVEFSYIRLGQLSMYKGASKDGQQETIPLYGFTENTKTGSKETIQFLSALGLTTNDAYRVDHDTQQNRVWYFESDTLINALSDALSRNSTATKATLAQYMRDCGGIALPETDQNGKTGDTNLEQGLYLVIETRVPENVTSTTDPFLVSLPMTTIDGSGWNYDVTVYPKNETGMPDLSKTVREAQADTGKNNGSTDDITDGYAHTATASDGDVVEYQVISTLPTITSPATALTTYTFVDSLSKGIQYNKNDVKLEFFRDKACTDLVAAWTEADGKFTASYTDYDPMNGSSMIIEMTQAGLDEINSAETVHTPAVSLRRGYSDLTLRITYACTVGSDAATVYGDSGNPNEVALTWKRINTDYYDTLKDCCHVYTYGIDLTKEFSDHNGDFSKVKFLLHNTTDGYYVQAALNQSEGVYYVTGHTAVESEATKFVPMSDGTNRGKVLVKGLEDDTYVITETATDRGYALLKEDITVVISQSAGTQVCNVCGANLLAASATVNGKAVEMLEDNGSVSALVPLTVVNTANFELPKTGGRGNKLLYGMGILALLAAVGSAVALTRKRRA